MMDLGIGEAVPDVVIEIATFGFGRQQLLVNLHGNAEVAVDRSAAEFQLQNGQPAVVGSGLERGRAQVDSWHGLELDPPLRTDLRLPHTALAWIFAPNIELTF